MTPCKQCKWWIAFQFREAKKGGWGGCRRISERIEEPTVNKSLAYAENCWGSFGRLTTHKTFSCNMAEPKEEK